MAARDTGPLAGLRVLEIATGVAGPYAGRLLAMLGATVVKLEPPGGDPARLLAVDDEPAPDPSPVFVHLNAGKRQATAERVDIGRAARWADVVLLDSVRRQVEGTALDPTMPAGQPDAGGRPRVIATVTAWGFDADEPGRPHDELAVQAACGLMASTTEPGQVPLRFPGWQSQYMAGAYAAAGALAVMGRPGPVHVDVSWGDALLTGIEGDVAQFLYRADPTASLQSGAFPAGVFRCADGFVIPGTVRPVDWTLQCQVYGRPDLADDERFGIRTRGLHRDELRDEIQPWYDAHTKREIFLAGLEVGWAVAMVVTPSDATVDPHMEERGFLTTVDVGNGHGPRRATIPARPWKASNLPDRPARLADRGEDTDWFAAELDGAGIESVAPTPDLDGVRVLELTWAWAGPFVGRFLGAFGADTVKIEAGRWPDGWRGRLRWKDAGVDIPDGVDPNDITWEASALFNGLNRNKRSCSVDLTQPDGRDVFLGLVAAADVLVLNMTHHVLSQRGVEDEVMAAVPGGLVVVNMPLLGASGPYKSMPGYGTLVEGMGGFAVRFGHRDEGARNSTTYYPDAVAGLHASLAALSGLAARARTGEGSYIDISQQEVTWLQLAEAIAHRSLTGRDPGRMGNAEPGLSPSGIYATADGEWLAVAVMDDDAWPALVAAAQPALDGLADLERAARVSRRDEVDAALGAWTASRTTTAITTAMHGAPGVSMRVVESFKQQFTEGELERRGVIERIDHPVTGPRWYVRNPLVVDGRRVDSTRPAPLFAAHTDAVLSEWAGLDATRIDDLREAEAVGTTPRQPSRR